ncbi:MAG: PadR family transcriptional regulator [candidate division Zixibacteria bacterium]|nr:PadR family transcriptional regulator [candidate division Zixibacteria bacterium]
MTKNELVVLGLLGEKPMYGYQLYQEIERREMEHWAQVNLASIYNTLNILQKDKLIEGKGERPGKMPERKVYHITARGKKRLGELVEMALNEQKMPEDSFIVGVAFLQGLSKEKILDALSKKKGQLRKVIERIEKIYQEGCCKMPYNWKFILEKGIYHLKVEMKHLDELARLVKRQKA